MLYDTYDVILNGWEAETEADAIEFARAFDFSDLDISENCRIAYGRYVDSTNGIKVYYDYGADYYFFCPEEDHSENA